jgi:hypothetical protein
MFGASIQIEASVAPPQFDTWHSEGASARERVWLRARARLNLLVLCTCVFVPTEAGRWDPRKGGPLAEEGGARTRARLAAGARLNLLVLCTCGFVPTEAGRWGPRKGGPACRGRWTVRAAASLGARWEAPRSSAPSSYLRCLLFPFCPVSLCGGSCGFLGPRCHWIGFVGCSVGLVGGRRGCRCHHLLRDSHRPPSRPRAARPLAPPHSSPPEQFPSAVARGGHTVLRRFPPLAVMPGQQAVVSEHREERGAPRARPPPRPR